jgi:hypothetical protein
MVNVANEENDCGCHYRGEEKRNAAIIYHYHHYHSIGKRFYVHVISKR